MRLDYFRKLPGTYPSPRDQNSPEAWIPIGQTSIKYYFGYFLFEFLPIGKEKQDGVVVRFSERRAGEGLVSIPGSMNSSDRES